MPNPAFFKKLEIPKLEEDSDQDQFADPDNLITHHNTHQESKQI